MSFVRKALDYWEEDATGSTSATATHAASAGKAHVITGLSGSGDAAGTVELRDGATVLLKGRFVAGGSYTRSFAPGTYVGTSGGAVSVVVSAGSATACEANIDGFSIRGNA